MIVSLFCPVNTIANNIADYEFPLPEPVYFENLENITMYAMGDSYFKGPQIDSSEVWVNRVGEKYNMNYKNYGISGSTVSNFSENSNAMVERYVDMESGDADVILIEGGQNDRNKDVPIGKKRSRDTKTFLGALNVMIDGCKEKYPNAVIILITPWYTEFAPNGTLTNVEYADAMRDLVKYRKDPRLFCIYAADKEASGVHMDDSDFKLFNCISPSDGSHLNARGMQIVQPFMETEISNALKSYNEYLEKKKNGCGSASVAPAAAVTAIAACVFIKKKEKNDENS